MWERQKQNIKQVTTYKHTHKNVISGGVSNIIKLKQRESERLKGDYLMQDGIKITSKFKKNLFYVVIYVLEKNVLSHFSREFNRTSILGKNND